MARKPILVDRYYADRDDPLTIVRPWDVEYRAVNLDTIQCSERHSIGVPCAMPSTMGKGAFRARFELIEPEPPCDPARYYTVELCGCCMIMLANGDPCQCPDDGEQHPSGLMRRLEGDHITLGSLAEEHDSACPVNIYGTHAPLPGDFECDCERDEFSRSQCDGCGTWLAGVREAATGWLD